MAIREIKDDILSLRGATVNVFGQSVTLPAEVDEDVVDIIDILERLEYFEVKELVIEKYDEENDDYDTIQVESIDEYLEYIKELHGLEEVSCGNSYNWMGRVSNHFNYNIYKVYEGKYLVEFKVHRFGDVRANYKETALLEFSYDNEFFEVIGEITKHIDYKGYDVYVSALSDMMEVCKKNGEYVMDVSDLSELDECVK